MRFELYLIHRATNSGPKSVDRASASTHESHALVLVGLLLPAAHHGSNDDSHMDTLYGLIDRICTSERASSDVVTTARVVARLYAWQLEEIDREG